MSEEENMTAAESPGIYGFLGPVLMIAMIAIAFAGASVNWIDMADSANMTDIAMPLGVLLIAGVAGISARPMLSSTPLNGSRATAVVILGGIAALFGADAAGHTLLGLIGAVTFLIVHTFERNDRVEEANLSVGIIAGAMMALTLASSATLTAGGNANVTYSLVDVNRSFAMSIFMSFWLLSIALSVTMVTALRGRTQFIAPGAGRWFRDLPDTLPNIVPISFGIWSLLHVISMLSMRQLADTDVYNLGIYLGNWWAVAGGIFMMIVAYLRSEGWVVVSAIIAANFVLYTLTMLQDIAFIDTILANNEGALETFQVWFTDTRGVLMWFFIWFFVNFGIVSMGNRGRFGSVAYRREPGMASKWFSENGYTLVVMSALIFGLLIRTIWNILPAMNANGTGLWDMTGGSDPWYMKRAVDYVVAHHSHFIIDADRAYPLGGVNPRPPLFTWSLALGGLAIHWITGMSLEQAVWFSVAGMPAIFGALIVLPVAASARTLHSKKAGMLAAWLIALMPSHVGHSTFGLADHDAFVILGISLAFYFWIRTVQSLDDRKLIDEAGFSPALLVKAYTTAWNKHKQTMVLSSLAGLSFATTALGWKGFVYGPGVVFLIFAMQILLNMFRRKDSMLLTMAAVNMMFLTLLLTIPVYGHNQLRLLFEASGLQPMFFIAGLTFGLGWTASAFRDKPWLLVLGTTAVLGAAFVGILAFLQFGLNVYNGWDILFTGGYYFSANKIFGTIAEAQAPDRATLFASYGPIVMLLGVGFAVRGIWLGLRKNDRSQLLIGGWVVIAAYMAWSAGRFIFNATPAMAISGAIAMVILWDFVGASNFIRDWRRKGTSTPRARVRSVASASRSNPMVPALFLVFLLVASQHMTYGFDSAIPRGSEEKADVDQAFHNLAPDLLRTSVPLPWLPDIPSILNSQYPEPGTQSFDQYCQGCRYMGTFGPGFNGGDWNRAYDWLAAQDTDMSFSEKPAFVSWWDYGFQALAQGQHPSVSDNFQSGIPATGNMLLADGQEDLVSLFVVNLALGDIVHSNTGQFTSGFRSALSQHMSDAQIDEFYSVITLGGDEEFVLNRSMRVVKSSIPDTPSEDPVYLITGHRLDASGSPSSELIWEVIDEDGEVVSSPGATETGANNRFNMTIGTASVNDETSHYIIGDQWYTADLMTGLSDVSTSLHRENARLALGRQMMHAFMDMDEMVDLYHHITTDVEYTVPSYDGGPGESITRNHDIRYFAVDSRLYPVGGLYNAQAGYHSYNPTGIFYAPTTLSGLDPNMYIQSIYQTQRGEGPVIERTQQAYEEEYLLDITRQQSGATVDLIELVDINYDQQPEFFETMIARTYVGYGTSTLGITTESAQPGQLFGGARAQGTPGSILQYARPMPGAMMNHFVLANWYEGENTEDQENIGYANAGTKILKYYSGATLSGTVELGEIGVVPNARILIERDAFSGEEVASPNGEVVDRDPRNWWIPIGTVDADENGDFEFTVPAGRIRVTAMTGVVDTDQDRDLIVAARGNQNSWAQWDADLYTPQAEGVRSINPVTGILGNVSGQTWLGETFVNVSGSDGHSNGEAVLDVSISVEASGVTGQILFTGHNDFEGDAVPELEVSITNIWDAVDADGYTLMISNGTVTGEDMQFSGEGEATFTGDGTVIATGTMSVVDFTGNYTRTILNNHSFTGNGLFEGMGSILGTVFHENGSEVIDPVSCENGTVPAGEFVCIVTDSDPVEHLIIGKVNADGRFTANGSALFTTEMSRRSFSGSGTFQIDSSDDTLDNYGVFNGTGTFVGTGTFSGDMVKPGSFHLVDAIPGDYHVTVHFPNGEESMLPMPLVVQSIPSSGVILNLPAGHLSGELSLENGTAVEGRVHLVEINGSAQDSLGSCDELDYAPCWIDADENGTFAFGPITTGNYTALVDGDMDGFSEIEQTFTVGVDTPTNITLSDPLPPTWDIQFTLIQDGEAVTLESNDTIEFENAYLEGLIPIEANYDPQTGEYNVELPPGVWTVNHDLNESSQFFAEFDLTDSEEENRLVVTQFEYLPSTVVTGTIFVDNNMDKPDAGEDLRPVGSGIEITARWGSNEVNALTNSSGDFSMLLPLGAEVNFTFVTVATQLTLSEKHTISEDMHVNMTAAYSLVIGGSVDMNRVGNQYDIGIVDFRPIEVVATSDEHSGDYVFEVDPDGRFSGKIVPGNWTLSVFDERLNAEALIVDHQGDNESYDIMTYPENITVEVRLFTDHSMDGNESNGTMRTLDFQLVPLAGSTHGVLVNVSADGTEWTGDGVAVISVEAGAYNVVIDPQNASDPANATAWNTVFFGDAPSVVYGLSNGTEVLSVPLAPEWLVHINLTNNSGGQVSQRIISFISADGELPDFVRYVDEFGLYDGYLPEGDWIVSIDPYITGTDPMAIYRALVTVNESTAPLQMEIQTVQSAHYVLNLTDASNEQALSGYVLTATSGDGLGEVQLASTDEDGLVDIHLYPGNWSVSINRTDSQTRWVVDSFSIGELMSNNGSEEIAVEADRWLQIGGNLFWDLDNDDQYDATEGVSGVNVTLTSNQTGTVWDAVSNLDGTWSLFVPAQENFTVTFEKPGFAAEEQYFVIDTIPVSTDHEMDAGEVEVSGIVDILPASRWNDIAENTEITLYPSIGFERAAVSPTKVMDNGVWTGEWSATIEPGDWVVYVTYDAGEGNLAESQVGVAALDASISDGGSVNITLENAGMALIQTKWFDFDGSEHTLNDTTVANAPMVSAPSVSFNMISKSAGWNLSADSNGDLNLLLPSGSVFIESEFHTTERDRDMEYSAGQSITIGESQEAPETLLEFSRRSIRTVNVTVASVTGVAEELDGANDVLFEESGSEYAPATFTYDAVFEGTVAVETYTVIGDVSGGEVGVWTVEFRNESQSDESASDAWVNQLNISMGLDDQMSQSITLRLTAPNQSAARHSDLGQELTVRFQASDGSVFNERTTVRIPQTYGLDFEDGTIKSEYGVEPGDTTMLQFVISNFGNGADTVDVNITSMAPESWTVLSSPSTSIGPGSSQIHTVDVTVPINESASSYDLVVVLTSEDGTTSSTATMPLRVARPILTFFDDWSSEPSQPLEGTMHNYSVTVFNTGLVQADDTVIEIVRLSGTPGAEGTAPMEDTRLIDIASIPAGENKTFTFMVDYTDDPVGTSPWFEVSINTTNMVLENEPEVLLIQETLRAQGVESTSNWLPLVVIVLVGFVIYGGTKIRGGRRPF